jgi:hypothetical protein
MAMTGKLKIRNGQLYVLYTYDEFTEPFRQRLWWRVLEVHRSPYHAVDPAPDDEVTYQREGRWKAGNRYTVVTGSGGREADLVERERVLPPPSRGKELRWNDGRWERLLRTGWVAAGEGDAPVAAARRRSGKTARQLNDEIKQATGIKVQG